MTIPDYNSPAALKALLDANGFSMQKKFGQNFLIDESILDKIIKAIPKNERNIVEIGVGLGDLTIRLLQDFCVTGYEIDEDLIPILQSKFKQELADDRLKLFCNDALVAWRERGLSDKPYFLAANLPYYVATKMILNAVEDELCVGFTLMIQREVALKFSAKDGESEFCALSILAGLVGGCELLFDAGPSCFNPPPKVTSSVIRLQKSRNLVGIGGVFRDKKTLENFKGFLRAAFSLPRKTLLKNLSQAYDKSVLKEKFKELNLAPTVRPHELNIASFLEIFEKIEGR